jgi:predicted Holliday junction resolvase-like endonuclease
MNLEDLIKDLKKEKNRGLVCPCCRETVPLYKVLMFTAVNMPKPALEFKARLEQGVQDLKNSLKEILMEKPKRISRATLSGNFGKILEKFAPALKGFGAQVKDCRPLFDPIDYIIFHGAKDQKIKQIDFIDVKTGNARLSTKQKQIKDAVEEGKLQLDTI